MLQRGIKLCMGIMMCIPSPSTGAPARNEDLHSTGRYLVDLQPVMLSEQRQYGLQPAFQHPAESIPATRNPVNTGAIYPQTPNGYYPPRGDNYQPLEQNFLVQPAVGRNPMLLPYQHTSYYPFVGSYGAGNEPSKFQTLNNAAGDQFQPPPVMYVVMRPQSSPSNRDQTPSDFQNYSPLYYSG